MEVVEDLSKLERIPLSIVIWERKRVVKAALGEELLILFESVEKNHILFGYALSVKVLYTVGKLYELVCKHVI